MKEIRGEIKEAFQLLCAVLVNGDNVELIAGAKEHLRKAYALTEGKKHGGQTDQRTSGSDSH